MTIDERVRHAMSGLRLKTDELGRPPSHDEVEAVLRMVIAETTEACARIAELHVCPMDGSLCLCEVAVAKAIRASE